MHFVSTYLYLRKQSIETVSKTAEEEGRKEQRKRKGEKERKDEKTEKGKLFYISCVEIVRLQQTGKVR